MKKLIAALLALYSSASLAQCLESSLTANATPMAVSPAWASSSALQIHMAPVKSKNQLTRYLKMTPASKNPLSALSSESRRRFLDSLTFNEKGITGYRYSELENELTPTQISKVLALFGSQENTSLFRKSVARTMQDRRLLTNGLGCDDGPEPADPGGWGDWGGEWGGGGAGAPVPAPPGPTEPRDYVGYKCDDATCKPDRDFICTRNCKFSL